MILLCLSLVRCYSLICTYSAADVVSLGCNRGSVMGLYYCNKFSLKKKERKEEKRKKKGEMGERKRDREKKNKKKGKEEGKKEGFFIRVCLSAF